MRFIVEATSKINDKVKRIVVQANTVKDAKKLAKKEIGIDYKIQKIIREA